MSGRQGSDFGAWRRRLDRREVLRLGGLGALGTAWLLSGCSSGDDLGDADVASGDGGGAATTGSGAPAGTSGVVGSERVPAITSVYSTTAFWDEVVRRHSEVWQELGLAFNPVPVSQAEWLDAIFARRYGDIQIHTSPLRPERLDPSEWIVSRAYGPEGEVGKRNYGNYRSKAYDAAVERSLVATDEEERRAAVFEAQTILREDFYAQCLVYDVVAELYNAEDWELGAEPVIGNGVLGDLAPLGLLSLTPKGERTRFTKGVEYLLDTSNIVATTGNGRNMLRLVYDTLVKLDSDLSVRDWVAEEWRQVDDVTWDVRIKDGLTFHDGQPLTVEDVRWTFQAMMDQQPGILSLVWEPVASVEVLADEERTVRFVLKTPRADFLTVTLMIAIVLPKHIWDTGANLVDFVVDSPETAVGSGPFTWIDYRRDDQLLLGANRDHFAAPVIDELLYLVSPTIDGNVGRLQTKEIDWMDAPSKGVLEQGLGFGHVASQETPSLGWNMMTPFIERMPWRDIEFRRAWAHTLDRSYCADVVLEGLAIPAESGSFMSPDGPWGNPDLDPIPFDPERARTILTEAGYTWDGDGRLMYPDAGDADFQARIEQVTSRPDDWWGPASSEVGPPDGRV